MKTGIAMTRDEDRKPDQYELFARMVQEQYSAVTQDGRLPLFTTSAEGLFRLFGFDD